MRELGMWSCTNNPTRLAGMTPMVEGGGAGHSPSTPLTLEYFRGNLPSGTLSSLPPNRSSLHSHSIHLSHPTYLTSTLSHSVKSRKARQRRVAESPCPAPLVGPAPPSRHAAPHTGATEAHLRADGTTATATTGVIGTGIVTTTGTGIVTAIGIGTAGVMTMTAT